MQQFQQWFQQQGAGNATAVGPDGSPAPSPLDLTPSSLSFLSIGGIILLLALNFKFILAAAVSFYAVNSFGDGGNQSSAGRKNKKQLERVVGRLLGEPPDPLEEKRLTVTRLNDELVSMRAAILEQTDGALAAEELRRETRRQRFLQGWDRCVRSVGLTEDERRAVGEAVRSFADKEAERRERLQESRQSWLDANAEGNVLAQWAQRAAIGRVTSEELELQDKLLGKVKEALPDKDKQKRVLEDLSSRGALEALLSSGGEPHAESHAGGGGGVYVLSFDGDPAASQGALLSQEINAILSLPTKPEEVVLRLKSPGGTVTGYGLAGAQLLRLRDHGVRLTVCVDELAASGGYLMACVADRILCSPFGAIGSIGVIAAVPNFGDRLEREGLKVIETTAGKWKRTVVPYREPSQEERAKAEQDISVVYEQFRGWVKQNRPSVDIDLVATGEVWYGKEALERGLVDELMTSSEYLLQRAATDKKEVLAVSYKPKAASQTSGALGAAIEGAVRGALADGAQSLASELVDASGARGAAWPLGPAAGGQPGGEPRRWPAGAAQPRFEADPSSGLW